MPQNSKIIHIAYNERIGWCSDAQAQNISMFNIQQFDDSTAEKYENKDEFADKITHEIW